MRPGIRRPPLPRKINTDDASGKAVYDEAVYADPALCAPLLDRLRNYPMPLRFMEVCGTHTVALFRSGLRPLLPENIVHLSGPGCPVCVTHDREIAACLLLAQRDDVLIATFGDLMRVPGPQSMSLQKAKAGGAFVEIVYSPLDALALARTHPDKTVVFIGVGFETTAPATAAAVLTAHKAGLRNLTVLSFHKLVPPVLRALLDGDGPATRDVPAVDAFLLPGHVSTILGLAPYRFLADDYGKTGVVGGFTPADILHSLLLIQEARAEGIPMICNQYVRGVSADGNPKAREILFSVFARRDALWRGMGMIPDTGLGIHPEYAAYDALERFSLTLPDVPPIKGCSCGDVLKGRLAPPQCPLFGGACTPASPIGPCMVSTEGSCAAYFLYGAVDCYASGGLRGAAP